jgi:RNA polymerase subunit RPABC4/transcription elongation factor Spt4
MKVYTSDKHIYFCQGCSAVLKKRVNYCPHCGDKQFYEDKCSSCNADINENDKYCPECGDYIERDEDKTRYCPYCGYNLDTNDRDLDLKYCSGVDCGKEIGGLIRYSEQTGGRLSLDEIFAKNDHEKEITDWLASVSNGVNDTCLSCFDRMLYIYDKTQSYSSHRFISDFSSVFEGIYIHKVDDFEFLTDDKNLEILSAKEKHPSNNYKHCLCTIDIREYSQETEAHDFLEGCKDIYYFNLTDDRAKIIRKLDVSFVFISGFLPEQTKLGTIYDKYFLTITPEILKSVEISKIWKKLKKS